MGDPVMQVLSAPAGKGMAILAAHPEGCRVQAVRQITRAAQAIPQPLPLAEGRTALVIGSTTLGFGSSTAIALRAAGFENIIGLGHEGLPVFEKDGSAVRRVSPGWYLTSALHQAGTLDRTYIADAFQDGTRNRVIEDLRNAGLKLDALFYSVAAPRRTYQGQTWASVIKVNGEPLYTVGIDYKTGRTTPVRILAATAQERFDTIQVMGGQDLQLWVGALLSAGLLNEGATVAAYSYIGSQDSNDLRRVYWEGTMGDAKKDIDRATRAIREQLRSLNGKAFSAVLPAVVTTASAAIPSVVKYLAAYLGANVASGVPYLDPLDVALRMVSYLYGSDQEWKKHIDSEGRLRLDTDELAPRTQRAIREIYDANGTPGCNVTPEMGIGLQAFHWLYENLFGFQVHGVNYQAPARFDVPLDPAMGVVNLLNPDVDAPIPVRPIVPVVAPVEELLTDAERKHLEDHYGPPPVVLDGDAGGSGSGSQGEGSDQGSGDPDESPK